jgi:hypothetical protein
VIGYLKGTAGFGLHLRGKEESCPLREYCIADSASRVTTLRSITGYVVQCGIGSIAWRSVKQPTVCRYTAESEYMAAVEVAKDIDNVHALATQFGLQPGCIPAGIDNAAALRLIDESASMSRTKHIDIVHHHIRERVNSGQMMLTS